MTNLTDAQLDELQQEAWNHPVSVARALAELRQVREQKRYSDAGFASTLKRAVDRILALLAENDRLLDENERLRTAGSALAKDAKALTGWDCGCTDDWTCGQCRWDAAIASVKETK